MKIAKWALTNIEANITEARLLTKEEAEALPERLRLYRYWWWTSTADIDSSYFAWNVCGDYGCLVDLRAGSDNAVRPALIFESPSLKAGDKFFFGGKEFEVIKEGLAFCTTDIGESAFREDWQAENANDYEKSDIKKYIDNWFKESVK